MEKALSSEQRLLLKDVTDREKRLKSFKNDTVSHAVEISGLQEDLREKYQNLIMQHPSFGSLVSCKEIEEKLWKFCFYVKIEEYRKSIRKTVSLRDGQEGPDATPAAVSLALKARTHLAKLISAFTKFLSDGTSFYQEFMMKLEASYKVHHHGQPVSTHQELRETFILCIFRCLMYLGDLARYRELYCDSKVKDYTEAERYYERASYFSNNSGHPHNQLAVLASYADMDCSAVYHYCRSVLILKPFASGFDNLRLVFDRNLRAYSALSEEPSVESDALSQADHKKSLVIRAQSFFIRFVRLHGDLFSWTHTTATSITDRQQASYSAGTEQIHPYRAEKFDVPKCISLIQKVLSDFEFFMRYDEASIFSEMLLVRLLAIALFSVHYGSSIHGERAASEPLDSSITESLALYFLFNFISRCATLLAMTPSKCSKMIESNVRRVLPVLTVFADWCSLNPRYLGYSALGRDGKCNKSIQSPSDSDMNPVYVRESVKASVDLLKAEEEARSSVMSCIAFLESFVKSGITSATGASPHSNGVSRGPKHQYTDHRAPLKENIELRGFLPFKRSTNVWSPDPKGLAISQPIAVPDELARTRRLKDLAAFIEKLKSSPKSPVLKPQQSTLPLSVATVAAVSLNGNYVKEFKKIESMKGDSEKKDMKGGLLAVSGVVIDAAKQKEKEREKNIERFYARMGELRERMSEDQGAKKGKREESPKLEGERKEGEKKESEKKEGDKKEQRAGLLTIAPGVLTAARQKEKDKEKNLERYSKVRGEKRPEGKLVDTRTARTKSSFKDREKTKMSRISGGSASLSAARKVTDSTRSSPSQKQLAGVTSGGKEDFPPLPGAREPHTPSATLNYAASALFNPTAPVDADPFDDDSTLESTFSGSVTEDDAAFYYDDEAGLDAFNLSDAETAGKAEIPEDSNNWSYNSSDMGTTLASTAPLVSLLQPTNAATSGVFQGLFSGSGSGSNGGLFGDYKSTMPDLIPSQDMKQAAPFEDDDFADDVIVFRPAFSRINAGSSTLPPPPMSYIGSAATPTLQPYLLNGSSSGMGDLGGLNNQGRPLVYGSSRLTNPYQDGYGGALGTEPAWQTRDRMMTSSAINAVDINAFNRIPTRPMAFNDPLGFSAQSSPSTDIHLLDTHPTTEEKWWVSGQKSDVQSMPPGLSNRQNNPLEEPSYVSSRGVRGPPALQHVSSGWSMVPPYRDQSACTMPLHPPGLVPPPPGFTIPTSGSCAQSTQMQHGVGNLPNDSWTSNPFYRSGG